METESILQEQNFPEQQPEYKVPRSVLEKIILITGTVFSAWLLLCVCLEAGGLWTREAGHYKAFSVLMWMVAILFLISLVAVFFDKARGFAFILSGVASVASIVFGAILGTPNYLGYINDLGQTFTETNPFWWGHIFPAFIFVLCFAMWLFRRSRRKREEGLYLDALHAKLKKAKSNQ